MIFMDKIYNGRFWWFLRVASKAGRSLDWHPLPLNFVKINFDGSKYQDGSAASVFVIKDHKGEVVVSGCKALPYKPELGVLEKLSLILQFD